MYLNEFKLSGDLLSPEVSLIPNYCTPMNLVKLMAFVTSALLFTLLLLGIRSSLAFSKVQYG
jgi:hypothetical protein